MLLAARGVFPDDAVTVVPCDDDGAAAGEPVALPGGALARYVARHQDERWAWPDTATWYPALVERGVRVLRCHDLRLSRAILAASGYCRPGVFSAGPAWRQGQAHPAARDDAALFDWPGGEATLGLDEAGREARLQAEAIRTSAHPGRLRLLVAAESAGALAAVEMTWAGIPWRADVHDAMLRRVLGPRPRGRERPALVEKAAEHLRTVLGTTALNPDSPAELLAALRRSGLRVDSTSAHTLEGVDTPATRALADYRRLARLWSANGWTWQDRWVQGGRLHAEYVPGGVVTGRWAGHGGGALQLPKKVRPAVVADPGWKLVVADAAQLDPRILAALADDRAMIAAGAGSDLYRGIVERGVVPDRRRAKVAMLGAIYGATTGDSARLMPSLAAAFPRAIGLVEAAAATGRAGGVVTTRLGRTAPHPGAAWRQLQRRAAEPGASAALAHAARRQAGDRSRFIRNFVVQGTAAEWALCWLAGTRARLAGLAPRRDDL
ncbi:MAG TPA: bifunctional 3'-5' exonuclease/DNA polymerase, partial [Microbacteriaceae bacterium]|nr:bifunctional 3'-5' exonuclease/DNA polymerase [Microbacteriaceae bacterium]